MKHKRIIPLIIGTMFFGFANLIFHMWTDWSLAGYFEEWYGVNFLSDPSDYPDYIVLDSLYGGPRFGMLKLLQMFLVMGLAGYYTTKLLVERMMDKTAHRLTVILVCIFWILKVPIPLHLSHLPSIADGLIAL